MFEMIVEKDVPLPMNDGTVLRANIYRPQAEGRFPVVMAQGVYGKDVHFADGFKSQYERLKAIYPELDTNGTTGRYLRWEIADPERWVPDGYVLIQVDSRGTGKSPGFLDPISPREILDYYEAIEWAGVQPWSSGRVGLLGISYYGLTQWAVAALQPPHLAAIIPWEALTDSYRDWVYQGGILGNGFLIDSWWPGQVLVDQNGNAQSRYRDRDTGEVPTGTPQSEELCLLNRVDYPATVRRHTLTDAWHHERTTDLDQVTVPLLSAGNWGGPGMHLRGNIEGFLRAASDQKWLSMHIGLHWESFYLPEYVALQKSFFRHFLKGEDDGWNDRRRVHLAIRHVDDTAVVREEDEFPLARTQYVDYILDAASASLAPEINPAENSFSYAALGDGVSFSTTPFAAETEITGFVTAQLYVSSNTADMDIFAVLRLFAPDGQEVILTGAHEPTPIARGWLRASHRAIDEERSRPYRVFHSHREPQPLQPGEVVAVAVEIWPTCILVPAGYRLVLTLLGRDFEFPGVRARLRHDDPKDRPAEVFSGINTIYTGGGKQSYLRLPIIPLENSLTGLA